MKKPLILESVSKGHLSCTGESGSGEVTGPRTIANLALRFTGCEAGMKCNTTGGGYGAGEVQLQGYVGVPGIVKTGETAVKDKAGLTLEGESSIECAGGAVHIQLRGSAIGTITPTNAMAAARTWTFVLASKTRQGPEQFEGGGPQAWEWVVNAGAPERDAFSLQLSVTSAEKLEINTVV